MSIRLRPTGPMRLAWAADGAEGDDGPVIAIAEAGDFPGMAPMDEDAGADVRWAAAKWHLDEWLARPGDIEATLLRQTPPPGPSSGRPLLRTVRMPTLLARILARHGVDPRAFGVVAACRPGRWDVTLDGEACEVHVDRMGDHVRVSALVQPAGVMMIDTEAGHLALGETLPDSAAAAMIGRTTADAVDLPMLRGFEPRVVGVHEWAGTVLDYADEDVAIGDMAVEPEMAGEGA